MYRGKLTEECQKMSKERCAFILLSPLSKLQGQLLQTRVYVMNLHGMATGGLTIDGVRSYHVTNTSQNL